MKSLQETITDWAIDQKTDKELLEHYWKIFDKLLQKENDILTSLTTILKQNEHVNGFCYYLTTMGEERQIELKIFPKSENFLPVSFLLRTTREGYQYHILHNKLLMDQQTDKENIFVREVFQIIYDYGLERNWWK